MDQNSYQTDYYKTLMEVFPEHGERVEVYVGKSQQLMFTKLKILDLYTILTSQKQYTTVNASATYTFCLCTLYILYLLDIGLDKEWSFPSAKNLNFYKKDQKEIV